MVKQLENWLALYHTPGIGPAKFHDYLKLDPELIKLPNSIKPNINRIKQDLAWLNQSHQNHILTLLDPLYPYLLKKIDRPPPILYIKGNPKMLSQPQIAMVGSRNAQPYGIQQAKRFAIEFAKLGLIVTSGLAIGIDQASHHAALTIPNGYTIAVLAHGLNMIYPSQHIELAEKIALRGALVSEFPIDSKPLSQYFPRRNRIISGLSLGVLVVEAAIQSGSLITAEAAIEQGREVFAIPGAIHNQNAKGCHKLIKEGAKLVESINDVLEEFSTLLKYIVHDKTACLENQLPPEPLTDDLKLLNHIDYEMTPVDVIIQRSGLSVSKVSSILLQLELDGRIMHVPGGFIKHVRKF